MLDLIDLSECTYITTFPTSFDETAACKLQVHTFSPYWMCFDAMHTYTLIDRQCTNVH